MKCTHDLSQLVCAIIFLASLSQFVVSAPPMLMSPPNQAEVALISQDVVKFLGSGGCQQLHSTTLLNLLLQPLEFSMTTYGKTCTRPYPKDEHMAVPDPVGALCALAFSTLKEACAVNSTEEDHIDPAQVVKHGTKVTLTEVCDTLSDWVKRSPSLHDHSMQLYGNACYQTCAEQGKFSSTANKDCYGLYQGRKLLKALKGSSSGTPASSADTNDNGAPGPQHAGHLKSSTSAATAATPTAAADADAADDADAKANAAADADADAGGDADAKANADAVAIIAADADAGGDADAEANADAGAISAADNNADADGGPRLVDDESLDKSVASEANMTLGGPDGGESDAEVTKTKHSDVNTSPGDAAMADPAHVVDPGSPEVNQGSSEFNPGSLSSSPAPPLVEGGMPPPPPLAAVTPSTVSAARKQEMLSSGVAIFPVGGVADTVAGDSPPGPAEDTPPRPEPSGSTLSSGSERSPPGQPSQEAPAGEGAGNGGQDPGEASQEAQSPMEEPAPSAAGPNQQRGSPEGTPTEAPPASDGAAKESSETAPRPSSAPAAAGAAGSAGEEDAPSSAEKPSLVEKPPTPAEKPSTPAEKPPTPAEKPPTPAEKPPTPAEKPPTPAEKPPTPAEKPPTPAEKPPTPAEKPSAPGQSSGPDSAAGAGVPQEAPPARPTVSPPLAPEQGSDYIDSLETDVVGTDDDFSIKDPQPVYKAAPGDQPRDQQPGLGGEGRGSGGYEGGSLPAEGGDSNFFAYFLTAVVLCIVLYLAFHNKQKILAVVIEGRAATGRRRPHSSQYRRLDNSLEEAISSQQRREVANSIVY